MIGDENILDDTLRIENEERYGETLRFLSLAFSKALTVRPDRSHASLGFNAIASYSLTQKHEQAVFSIAG
jgi:hypothetical protein